MGMVLVILSLYFLTALSYTAIPHQTHNTIKERSRSNPQNQREIIDVKGGPEDVLWLVQLSDLHFSVHHPDRARDFKNFVGPSLSMINPSLVLITGDLTDGKSKDLLTMKQDEAEWMEYEEVMEDVIERSGLKKNVFYDVRGNHDNFGVPMLGGSFDFYSRYSINAQLGRSGQVNSVTIENAVRKLLVVGVDSTMSVGLRGPTNLFGHPTGQLLAEIDSELSQWNSESTRPVTKISFGHFPLSFSAAAYSGKTLKDIFLEHSLSAYLCGHLHTSFGKNLKRHHHSSDNSLTSQKFFQLNAHQIFSGGIENCSNGRPSFKEFWEWEMGDWRKNRAMRILAVDRGFLSFVDIDFKLGAKKTIVLPTFPLDSRFMLTMSSADQYKCQSVDPSSYAIRALVFSISPIVSVVARIYNSRPGNLFVVLESPMRKHAGSFSRGDLYIAPWNYKAFEDPSPDRFWLQIEATDIRGSSTLTELRPFSVNGLSAKLPWTWKEFLVMGCQWSSLYYPIFWSFYLVTFSILIIPKIILTSSNKHYNYKNYIANKGFINGVAWVLTELYRVPLLWLGILVYLFYLLLCPWLLGHVFTNGEEMGFMTHKGWVMKFNNIGKLEFIGFPDIMVVVLPHLFFVVLPTILVTWALAVERGMYREHFLSLSGKKEDDPVVQNTESQNRDSCRNGKSKVCLGKRWLRNILLLISLAIFWKHFKNCRALVKAYEINPLLLFPVYSLSMPLLLASAIYLFGKV
ncbi:putative metallophosphoesterase At3g03305 [Actinidia eriantha]|uniref:putative metallophosphoesterase At3g03305 n=1 Tax=Actinidia eriantha TaxID=165200 RepID=UPI002586E232|nr:putative metallophosphoesterase At3g03305 [Actinidia eriantha]